MEMFFNTVGPNKPDIHYEADEVMMLICHLNQKSQWYEDADNSSNMEELCDYNGHPMMVWGM